MIYIDSYFLINLGMNLFLLFVCGWTEKQEIRLKRIFMAATCGGLGACILLFLPRYFQLVGMIFLMMLMWQIAYQTGKIQQIFYGMVRMFLTACVLEGILNVIYYHTYDCEKNTGLLSTKWLFVTLLWLVPAILIGILVMKWMKKRRKPIYRVILKYQEKEIETYGLWDTGNRLVTAGGSPVSLAEKELLRLLLPEEQYQSLEEWPNAIILEKMLVFPVTYQCIGTEQGLLPAIRISKMTIYREGGTITIKNPVIGMGNRKFSKQNQYQVILNSEV